MNALEKARQLTQKAIESLYDGKCTVYEYQSIKDPITKITKKEPVPVLMDQPCRLSISNVTSAEAGTAASISQAAKLFISANISIKPGSKISVTQNGITTEYQRSGQPAQYSNHQEISLDLFKGWA